MAREGKNLVESTRVFSSFSSSWRPSSPVVRVRHRDCSTRMLLENHTNFKSSAAPTRLMYYDGSSWVDFPEEALREVKSAFLNRRAVIDLAIFGSDHLLDLMRMVIVEFASGKQRSIAWIDENGKCFFPRTFLGPVEESKIEIEVRIDHESLKREREEPEEKEEEEEEEEEVSSTEKRQRLGDADVAEIKWPGARRILEEERLYSMLRGLFLSGTRGVDPGAVLTGIYLCTRRREMEKAREDVFKMQEELTKDERGVSNTVLAWYGGCKKEVEMALSHGFGDCNWKSWSFGVGVYLSPATLPHLSAQLSQLDDRGEKHLILCRVILGNVEKVVAGSQQRHPSSSNFDTGSDDPTNPKWYVVWPTNMSRHISPLCILSFKPSKHVQGLMKGPHIPIVQYTLGTLIPKLKTFLPSTKIQEVVTLYDTFRAGKLARDVFLKQLRCVAGDQVLRSAVREIRGC